MAFGKSNEIKKIRNVVLEDQLWRHYVKSEEKTVQNWRNKWQWILEEYDELHRKLGELSADSAFLSNVNKNLQDPDTRTIKPIPESTNHEYGWLANKPEFRTADKFGPDVAKGYDLPDVYHIVKE